MLLTTRINNLTMVRPTLSRVWIKTGNPRMPLKSVWIDELNLHRLAGEDCTGNDVVELAEDHLAFAA
jgi:hypothetical protein